MNRRVRNEDVEAREATRSILDFFDGLLHAATRRSNRFS